MVETWLFLISLMLCAYVVLDGFDIGTGILHLFVAKTNGERELFIRSVGPIWDGNEVWLVALGGSLLLTFPSLLARAFSGFYLPLIIVLWLLTFRALGIELRHHVKHPMWEKLWDVAFAGSSILLAIFFGAALGNVVRGVTMDEKGVFFAPLWTNFRVGPEAGILDWYTILVAALAVSALAFHGLLWILWRVEEKLQDSYQRYLPRLFVTTTALTLAVTIATFYVQPQMSINLSAHWGWFSPAVIAIGGLGFSAWKALRKQWKQALWGSSAFLSGMILSAAAAVFPYVLPARGGGGVGLKIWEAASPEYTLQVALWWWIPGMLLAISYFVYNYTHLGPPLAIHDDAPPE